MLKHELENLLSRGQSLQVNRDELYLLDWVLLYPAPAQTLSLDDAMKFADLRYAIWDALHEIAYCLARDNQQSDRMCWPLAVVEQDARVLLALVPTTFHWGAGADCGLSLKGKLFRLLSGKEEYHASSNTDTGSYYPSTEDYAPA